MKIKVSVGLLIAVLAVGATGLHLASAQPGKAIYSVLELPPAQQADSIANRGYSSPETLDDVDEPEPDRQPNNITNQGLPMPETQQRISEALAFSEYTDLPSFAAGAGGHLTNITFQNIPEGTILTNHYLDVRAEFVDGNDTVVNRSSFVTDKVGVDAHGRVHLRLTEPAIAIGADFPGALTIELYDQQGGTLLYTSSDFAGVGKGFFGGVVTDMPFTFVVFRDWWDDAVYLDNIHVRFENSGTRYVKPTGDGDCSSWANACSLQAAFGSAGSGDEIWVAAGTHKPGAERTSTFQLKSGVAVYGGFAGTENSLAERNPDPATNSTVLSGDIGTPGFDDDNVYRVVVGDRVNETAVLDGFTITGGYANIDPFHDDRQFGGGLFAYDGHMRLENLMFENNTAKAWGGGLYINASNPTLGNVTFRNNTAYQGGGMTINHSNPTLTDVTFSDNHVFSYGGGIYNWNSSPKLTNVAFSGNSAYRGGGVFNQDGSPGLANVTFSGNSASQGGGMFNAGGSPMLTNVTFSQNEALITGGAMFNNAESTPALTNCILWGNLAADADTSEIFNQLEGMTTISYSDVAGSGGSGALWNEDYGIDGWGNLDDDPQFVDAQAGRLRLQVDSPAIDSGLTGAVPADSLDLDKDGDTYEPLPYDIDGYRRIFGEAVDMGACEFNLFRIFAPIIMR
jgi:hypothetical protein